LSHGILLAEEDILRKTLIMKEILKRENSGFTVRDGNRLYVNKKLFDEYLERCAKYRIPI
jgi:uncharacterized protein (UPF0216 family)